MRVSEYADHDATGLASLIATGEVKAAEVQSAAFEALEAINPELNALVGEPFHEPLDHDEKGPFAGQRMVRQAVSICPVYRAVQHDRPTGHERTGDDHSGWRADR